MTTRQVEQRIQRDTVSSYRGAWGYPRIEQPDSIPRRQAYGLIAVCAAIAGIVAWVGMR